MSPLPKPPRGARSKILRGDCLRALRKLPPNSCDSLVTDPPAGISFMGNDWDHHKGGRDAWIAWMRDVMAECLRVLKPGAHGFVWALPRTAHWTATACEDAGFEVREKFYHLFGSGFPKSHNVSKAIDKLAGAEREVIGSRKLTGKARVLKGGNFDGSYDGKILNTDYALTAPATEAAKQWDGWGSATKPAAEEWIMVRKPLARGMTIAENVLAYGTGAINVDASRIQADDQAALAKNWDRVQSTRQGIASTGLKAIDLRDRAPSGRWPANVVLSCCGLTPCVPGCAVAELDRQSGTLKSGAMNGHYDTLGYQGKGKGRTFQKPGDSGGASRFFYCAKPSRAERDLGLSKAPKAPKAQIAGATKKRKLDPVSARFLSKPIANVHPTVKPTRLMRYLITLVTAPGGTVLDPFAGSGSTLVAARQAGFRFIGIERDKDYVKICRARIKAARPAREERPAC